MITRLSLRNFRGAREVDIDIAPITILTGPNNSGKSTLMYGLLAAKNVLATPNQPLDSLFNFVFLNLGGYKESVYLKDEERRQITIGLENRDALVVSRYQIILGKKQSKLQLVVERPHPVSLGLDVTFPYALDRSTGTTIKHGTVTAKIAWNGVTPTVTVESLSEAVEETGEDLPEGTEELLQEDLATEDELAADLLKTLSRALSWPTEETRKIDFIPLRRGFTDPVFSPSPLQPQLIDQKEIATLIANDSDLETAINFYLEKILNKSFRMRAVVGTANFYLRTMDRETGFDCLLVNEGFGTNQLVYLLAKALHRDRQTVCIEEPEIHLNPGAVIKLAEVLVEIAKDRARRFIVSTHSEHFITALLNKVARQEMGVDDLRVYYVYRDQDETRVELQQVNDKGQVEGGLRAFYDAELSQIRDFLRVEEGQ